MFPLFAGLAKNQPALHGSLFEPSHLRILAELGMFADVPLGSTHATVLKVIDLVSRSEVDRTVHALVSRTRVLRAALGVSGILKLSALLAIAVNMAPAREPPRDSAPAPAQVNSRHLPVAAVSSSDKYLATRFIMALQESHRFVIAERFGRSLEQLHAGSADYP